MKMGLIILLFANFLVSTKFCFGRIQEYFPTAVIVCQGGQMVGQSEFCSLGIKRVSVDGGVINIDFRSCWKNQVNLRRESTVLRQSRRKALTCESDSRSISESIGIGMNQVDQIAWQVRHDVKLQDQSCQSPLHIQEQQVFIPRLKDLKMSVVILAANKVVFCPGLRARPRDFLLLLLILDRANLSMSLAKFGTLFFFRVLRIIMTTAFFH